MRFVLGFVFLVGFYATPHAEEITACELLQSQQHGDIQLLDVRSVAEYEKGHIMGAKLIPHTQLQERITELDADQPVVVYCQSGRRAGLAETVLKAQGFKQVDTLQGHWKEWDTGLTLLHCKNSIIVEK